MSCASFPKLKQKKNIFSEVDHGEEPVGISMIWENYLSEVQVTWTHLCPIFELEKIVFFSVFSSKRNIIYEQYYSTMHRKAEAEPEVLIAAVFFPSPAELMAIV
jgi:hypothetical protein